MKTKKSDNQENRFLALNVNFTIKINKENYSYAQYESAIRSHFLLKTTTLKAYIKEKFETLLKNYDKKSILIITDYSEKKGSFIITFSFLIFSSFMSYGQFRESVDYLKKDIEDLLEYIFPDSSINIMDKETSNQFIDDFSENLSNQISEIMKEKIKRLKGITIAVALLLFGLICYIGFKVETQPAPQIDPIAIESIIRTELRKINEEKQKEELLQLLKQHLQQDIDKEEKAKQTSNFSKR